jgi:hypothetical protein
MKAWLAIPLALGACGPGDERVGVGYAPQAVESAPPQVDAAVSDAGAAEDTGAAEPDPLGGVWAMRLEVVSLVEIPFVGQSRDARIAYGRTVFGVRPNGGARFARTETCAVVVESSQMAVETVIPEAFARGLGAPERPFTYDTTSGRFTAERFVEVRGARLDDLEGDALPTAPDDPRVFDQDDDGQPGMTVRISGLIDGEVYVVQRGIDALEGERTAGTNTEPTRLEGRVVWSSEQAVLGADTEVLAMSLPTSAVEDPAAHSVVFTRLGDTADCTAALAAFETENAGAP